VICKNHVSDTTIIAHHARYPYMLIKTMLIIR